MRRGWIWAVFLAAFAAEPLTAQQPPPSRPSDLKTEQPPSNPTLNRAEALLEAGHWKTAHDLLVPWFKNHPAAPDLDRAVFLLARTYYQSGDRVRAFYHLDELMDDFPESKFFYPSLELQYQIAIDYLNGYKNSFFGLRIVPGYDEAIEMLFRIQERSPGSPLAEKALRLTADYYFNSSQFDLAADAYSTFIRSYPRSPDIPQVKLRQAFSSLAQFRNARLDATPLIDARAQFKALQVQYPEIAAEANAAQWIEWIDGQLARKAYITADFYRRTGKLTGAVFLYRYVVQTYPNSHEAALSRRDLERMPPWALRQPPPPQSNPEAAAQALPTATPPAPAPASTGKPR